MNDLTVKHKKKSIFNNLNKITNNPNLFKQKIDINDIEDKNWLSYLTKKLKWKKLY